jgi:hypothetical protein
VEERMQQEKITQMQQTQPSESCATSASFCRHASACSSEHEPQELDARDGDSSPLARGLPATASGTATSTAPQGDLPVGGPGEVPAIGFPVLTTVDLDAMKKRFDEDTIDVDFEVPGNLDI